MSNKFKKILALSIVSTLLLVACGNNHENEAKLPVDASEYKNANYQDVITELEQAGFTNIEVEVIDDLITGWLTKDGEIEEISIDGNTTFSAGTYYAKDAKIIISYHTFPEEVEVPEETTVTEEVQEEQDEQEVVTTPEQEVTTDASVDVQEIITVENNPEFAALLAENVDYASISNFVAENKGKTISFQGHIANMANHGNYTTRFDVLIYIGEYELTTAVGKSS
ncbi:MAG: DUF4839 domain-containing protein, partial [Culicoidibacterales bacterium]